MPCAYLLSRYRRTTWRVFRGRSRKLSEKRKAVISASRHMRGLSSRQATVAMSSRSRLRMSARFSGETSRRLYRPLEHAPQLIPPPEKSMHTFSPSIILPQCRQ
jgi:hypothetical protein